MKIKDIMLYFPRGIYSSLAKMARMDLNQEVKNRILNDGMLHFVPNEDVAQAIIDSEYLKPASGAMKYINSYGKPCACMFAGKPDLDNYSKNLSDYHSKMNPYVNPCMVATAVKITPSSEEQLNNYKFRGLADEAVICEGFCILPHKCVNTVKMVPDLVRDNNGNPVKNDKGEYSVSFREARKEELVPGSDIYLAQKDYLDFMKTKRMELGYSKENKGIVSKINNSINNVIDQGRMEGDITVQNVKRNWRELFTGIIQRITTPKMASSVEDTIKDFKFKKSPYQDERFAKFVASIQSQEGLEQLKLKDVLSDLNQSNDGQYLAQKHKIIEGDITRKGIHGKDHSNRVTINSMIIARREGILENDKNNRIKDILITASMYHDIGRITDSGPHAGRSARKIKNMDLTFSDGRPYSEDDKKLVMALVEGHEGKPNKINKLLDKYHINDAEDRALALKLNTVLRDSDALDRVRLDRKRFGYKVNLNPNYLVNDTSKQLLNAAYELENLTKNISDVQQIFSFDTRETVKTSKVFEQETSFDDRYKCPEIEGRIDVTKLNEKKNDSRENSNIDKGDEEPEV